MRRPVGGADRAGGRGAGASPGAEATAAAMKVTRGGAAPVHARPAGRHDRARARAVAVGVGAASAPLAGPA